MNNPATTRVTIYEDTTRAEDYLEYEYSAVMNGKTVFLGFWKRPALAEAKAAFAKKFPNAKVEWTA